jgi:hypothetical protein
MGECERIKWLADKYEIPLEQAMLVYTTILACEDLGNFDNYYCDSGSVVESIFDRVFNNF